MSKYFLEVAIHYVDLHMMEVFSMWICMMEVFSMWTCMMEVFSMWTCMMEVSVCGPA